MRQERFRENLRQMVQARGLSQREVAREIGVPWNWFRKACSDGIARSTPRNEERLQAIARYFGLVRTRLLWSPHLFTKHRPETNPKTLDEYFQMLQEIHFLDHSRANRIMKSIERAWVIVNAELLDTSSENAASFDEETENEELIEEDDGFSPFDVEPPSGMEDQATDATSRLNALEVQWDRMETEHASPTDDEADSFDRCGFCGQIAEVHDLSVYGGYCESCASKGHSKSVRRFSDDDRTL